MKAAYSGIAWFADNLVAELYDVELVDGTALHITTLDVDVAFNGHTYLSNTFNIERGAIKTNASVTVDDVELTLYAPLDCSINGTALPGFVLNGGFDGAWITVWRARQARVTHLFKGMVTDVGIDPPVAIKVTVSSPLTLLNIDMPRNRCSAGCIWQLYGVGCGLSRDGHHADGVVTAGATTRAINTNLTQAADYFDEGKVLFTGGINAGAVRTVRAFADGRITLSYPLATAPAVGDTFTVWQGCDKRLVTCQGFGNQARYRGMPFMPKDTAAA